MAIDVDGNLLCLEESYRVGQLLRENALVIRNLLAKYGKQEFTLLHPSSAEAQNNDEIFSVLNAFVRERVPVRLAQRALAGIGIDLIREHLRIDPNRRNSFNQEAGAPRLFISRQRCPSLWREMVGLRMETRDGLTSFVGADHTVTCLRDILMARPKPPGTERRSATVRGHYASAWS
jgi:hypothetical protein